MKTSVKTAKKFVEAVAKANPEINAIIHPQLYSVASSKPSQPQLPDYSDGLNKLLVKDSAQTYTIAKNTTPDWTLIYFFTQVNSTCPWDYKLQENWENDISYPYLNTSGEFLYNGEITTAEDFGNLHYGFVGTAMGFDPELLYIGGGYAAIGKNIGILIGPYYGDDMNDHYYITKGIMMYQKIN